MKTQKFTLIQFLKYSYFVLLLIFSGCYSLLPVDEVDNGIQEDSRTWKYYQIIWKPGEKPNLERLLRNYYRGDCNPGCVYEYILTVNFIEELSEYQIKNQGDKIPEGSLAAGINFKFRKLFSSFLTTACFIVLAPAGIEK